MSDLKEIDEITKDADNVKVNPAGHCPICEEEMYQKDAFVICPNGDYKARFDEWDERWNNFVNKFLEDLISLNMIMIGK